MAKKVALSIIIDDLTGEIEEVRTTKRFEEEGPLFKLDILNDTIEALNKIYEYEKELFFNKPGIA